MTTAATGIVAIVVAIPAIVVGACVATTSNDAERVAAQPAETDEGDMSGLAAGFAALPDVVWPVRGTSAEDISSTFGPRIRQSTQAYDFHRGLDVHAEVGEPVVAVTDGVLHGVRIFEDGGLSVILDHQLPASVQFRGRTIDEFHTHYFHLDRVPAEISEASAADEPLSVSAGTVIGFTGTSGATTHPHLHFEVRVGSRCSLEYQLRNPESSCAMSGIDPHVHPLLLLGNFIDPSEAALRMSGAIGPNTATFDLSQPDEGPTINRYEVTITERGNVEPPLVLDLTERVGFDARTNAQLDRPDWSSIHLEPQPFGTESSIWRMQVVVPLPGRDLNEIRVSLTTTDVFGESQTHTISN